ncbi:hypothetical protein LSTR_LSTR012474 [Laodelphax striatellus]|uniref:Uncharacterized protein n=1 Tax=Laodelphax striatellus TaxID=195883 RepID=A0A482WNR6_LAOST|nr:hypothetical protein LSTR_LSTR012474 [Laodelphax striatellus]
MSTAKRVLQFLDEEGELPESDVGRWLHEKTTQSRSFVYGYEKITLLNTMLQLDDRENVEYVDLSSPYLFHEMPNLDTLMKNATGVYCPEHFLLNFCGDFEDEAGWR